jgi:hypothetical protein
MFASEKENGEKTSHLKTSHSNVSYAKKNFYRDENGKLNYKIKISSDCLRNNMFRNDLVAQTPSIQHNDVLLYSYIATPLGMIRGYMFTSKEVLKRKSPLTITDAEQTSNNKSYMEFKAKSGEKNTEKDKVDSDTTIFNKETVGEIFYEAEGNINLSDLQFVGCDSIFDRVSFNSDLYESLYKPYAEMNIPNFQAQLGFFTLTSSVVDMSEYGLKLSNENVVFLTKETLKKLLGIAILRNNSFARTHSLKVKLVYNPLVDTFKNEEGWITIKTIEDINNLDFNVEDFYSIVEESKAKKLRQNIEEAYQQEQQKKKDKKAKDKKAKTTEDEEIA